MKVLITGIAGFIGSHLAEALLADGHEVAGVDDLSTGRRENVPDKAWFHYGDVRGWLPPGAEVIYHCAASYKDRTDWERDASVNVLGTINVVREAAKTGARLVYFQTSLCYGLRPVSPISVDAPLAPTGSYAVTKTAGEAFIRDSGLDWVSLRLANVYGPRNLSGAVPTFYQRIAAGKPCTAVETRRDQVYIDDLVRLARTVLDRGSGPYHAASGADVWIPDLYSAIADEMASDHVASIVEPGPDDAPSILLDPSRTTDELGWTATVPLAEGIARTVAWYREHPPTETYSHLVQR